ETILSAQGAEIKENDETERERIEASARNVLKTRRSYLDALIRDYNSYFTTLVDLDAKQTELVRVLDDYTAFLDQHVLWIPNAALPTLGSIADWRDAALWLVDPHNYAATGRRLLSATRSVPVGVAAGLLLVLTGVAYRRRLKRMYAGVCASGTVEALPAVPATVAAIFLGAL